MTTHPLSFKIYFNHVVYACGSVCGYMHIMVMPVEARGDGSSRRFSAWVLEAKLKSS